MRPPGDRRTRLPIGTKVRPIQSQSKFDCRSCGFVEHADVNASYNIAARAAKMWECGAESAAPVPG
ncbi:zinc ribbon domain-containing protein [Nocardia cyriacigeorgica]|uniref:zinc ribbon domain-containing protein n=1 Tax=Nocardia cyriacigeorgica TaxID=135487 RepID=UPI002B4B1430|nr:zinc ribbon domain-containing protein [Nocardia cyriacigeorgica]